MISKRKKTRGMSIVEVMVYSVLIGLVLTGIYGILTSSMKYYRITEVRSDLQQNGIKAISGILGDMMGTPKSTIVMGTNPDGVFFVSSRKSDGNHEFDNYGMLKWQKWVCYYLEQNTDGTYNLVKKESPISTPSSDPGTAPYTTVSQFAAASLQKHKIAENIQSMNIVYNSSTGCYNIDIQLDKTTDTSRPNRMQVQTEIYVRN